MAEPDGGLKKKFEALQVEYSEFYRIRNHPTAKTEFEKWRRLGKKTRENWAKRLNMQALKVRTGIEDLEELKEYRPYHEMRAYFGEDVREMEKLIGKYGFNPKPA